MLLCLSLSLLYSVLRNFSAPIQTIDCFEIQETFSHTCLDAIQVVNSAKDLCSNYFFQFNEKLSKVLPVDGDTHVGNILCEIQVLKFNIQVIK